MTMCTVSFLCALGLFAALQVPGTLAEEVPISASDKAEIVDKHNALRRGVQPTASNMLEMSWSDEAQANAQKWADTCSMKHSPVSAREISSSGCGENLFMSSAKLPWSTAVQAWYNEVKNFRLGQGSVNGGVVGHFTQVVWYRSNKVGCAIGYCPNSKYKYFYVCQYCPPGNYGLSHPYKSGPTCGDCPNACDNGLCTNPCSYANKYGTCPNLAKTYTCNHPTVASWCPGSCKCPTEII